MEKKLCSEVKVILILPIRSSKLNLIQLYKSMFDENILFLMKKTTLVYYNNV